MSEIRRIGRIEFTNRHLVTNVLRISANACRGKVTGWINAGLVAQAGEIQKGGLGGRPVKNYRVVDTRAALLASGQKDAVAFARDHLLECKTCEADQIADLDQVNPGQAVICSNCGASLGL